MKKIILLLSVLFVVPFLMPGINGCRAQNIGINSTGATPDSSAMLDIVSTSKGILIPRVALTATNSISPITLPAPSLLVYNTSTAGTSPTNVMPGFYYWNGTGWIRILNNGNASGADWSLTGNSGTTASTAGIGSTVNNNFIGTNDANDFAMATSNIERMRITSAGNIGIGVTSPVATLQVAGSFTSTGGAIDLNNSTANTTTIGNGTNALIENGNFSLNVSNGAATTSIATGTTSGNVVIGSAAGYVGIRTVPAADPAPFEVNGYIHWTGIAAPEGVTHQLDVNNVGGYLGWNVSSAYGETDFYNNAATGTSAGFAFYNVITPTGILTPTSGLSASVPLMYIAGATFNGATAGNVSIGGGSSLCFNPTSTLYVQGTISASSTITASHLACASDVRFKKEITPLSNSLSNLLKLQGVNYHWKKNEFPERQFSDEKQIGFIAQELEKIYPELIFTDKQGYKYVDYSHFTPVLSEAIKEQQKIIDGLSSDHGNLDCKLQQLEIGNKNLELKIRQLESQIADIKNLLAPPVKKLTLSSNN